MHALHEDIAQHVSLTWMMGKAQFRLVIEMSHAICNMTGMLSCG